MTDQRLQRLREELQDRKLDALLVASPETVSSANCRYLSGFTGSSAYLFVARDDAVIATDSRYWEQAERQVCGFRLHKAVGALEQWLPALLQGLGGLRIGFEASQVSYQSYRTIRNVVRDLREAQRPKLAATTDVVESLRATKEPEEIAAIQAAIDLGDAAFEYVAERVEPGWTEKRVAWEIEKYVREHGGDGSAFAPIVAGGPWGAMAHARPRDRALEDGEGIVIDMGVQLDGYMSDLTRTIHLGKPDDKFKRIYDIVLAAQQTAIELIESGMTGEDAHLLAHRVIEESGHGDDFGHGLGHGLGLQAHEKPRVGKASTEVLADGMVFTIEPGIYLTGWGGVRIEDVVVLEDGRSRVLSHAPKLSTATL